MKRQNESGRGLAALQNLADVRAFNLSRSVLECGQSSAALSSTICRLLKLRIGNVFTVNLIRRDGDVVDVNWLIIGGEAEEARRPLLMGSFVRDFDRPLGGLGISFFPGFGPDHTGLVRRNINASFEMVP